MTPQRFSNLIGWGLIAIALVQLAPYVAPAVRFVQERWKQDTTPAPFVRECRSSGIPCPQPQELGESEKSESKVSDPSVKNGGN